MKELQEIWVLLFKGVNDAEMAEQAKEAAVEEEMREKREEELAEMEAEVKENASSRS